MPRDTEPEPRDEAAPRRPDASMTLITSMLERPLDPGYQAAADARKSAGLPPSTGWGTPVLVVYLLLLGLLLGVAGADLRSREGARAATRADLVERVQAADEVVDERTAALQQLRAEVDDAATALDRRLASGGAEELDRLRLASGAVAVTGPGLQLTLDDAETASVDGDGDPRTSDATDGRVQSRDLQIIVNGLWAAGAEAVAINGQRLTSQSAIRFAGDAILVNFRPLTRPYVVQAVGDPTAMETAFASGTAGAYATSLQQNFQITVAITTSDSLSLPSVASTTLRRARPADTASTEETS
ncbi:DUF881 domain-containing protein [Marihabitans asiaticum]|uniref:Uncharacterized protein YlxW (UPF0749 family) n=1 Tax=Marihabitans asiaticum TaxID=415218 RepID=A0A560W6M0_9MICO|nr:DUF881 domain-containing protein [Marihabitans asiaticum]TWD13271.1 uncharacterized protein YlxW (UPF0749 family) [Marihabitans asiaticum]